MATSRLRNVVLTMWMIYSQLLVCFSAAIISDEKLNSETKNVLRRTGLDSALNEDRCKDRLYKCTEYSILWFNDEISVVNFNLNNKTINVIMENSLIALPASAACTASSDVSKQTDVLLRQIWNFLHSWNVCQLTQFLSLNFTLNRLTSLNEIDIVWKQSDCKMKLKILDISHNNVTQIDKSFRNMPNLIILNLSSNNLNIANVSIFNNLKTISLINLNNNNLTHLHENIFDNNVNLEILDLSHNHLTSDVWNSLKPLSKLRYLNLESNVIASVDNGINGLNNLEYLNVISNKLSTLANDLKLPKLKFLFFKFNTLIIDRKTAFNGFKELEMLDLSDNGIDHLDSEVFIGNTQLKYLDLENNKLKSVPKVDNLKQLVSFLLKDNQITSLNQSTFVNVPMLKNLDLSFNKINHIEPGTFDATNILFLDLADNSISNLNNVFDKSRINTLDLSSNPLTTLIFSQLPQFLEKLTITGSSIQFLDSDDCIKHLKSRTWLLKELRLSDIKTSNFENVCIPPSVEKLDLSDNSFQTFSFHPEYQTLFHQNAVDLNEVRLINNNFSAIVYKNILTSSTKTISYAFKDNPLKCDNCDNVWLQDEFQCTKNTHLHTLRKSIQDLNDLTCASNFNFDLRSLPISDACSNSTVRGEICNISNADTQCKIGCTCGLIDKESQVRCLNLNEIPKDIGNATVVRLDGNNFSAINYGDFALYVFVTLLYLNNSNINTISPNALDPLKRVQILNLACNNLTALPPASLNQLPQLTHLDLSNNSLTALPDELFMQLKNLKFLHLQDNRLKELPLPQFKELTRLREIYLYGNSLTCNCGFVEDVHFYQRREIITTELKCSNENGTQILFTQSTCTLDRKYSHSWLYILGVLLALIGIATTVVLYWYEIQVLIYSRWRVRFCSIRDLEQTENKNYDGFLIYSDQDLNFMFHELLPGLERISRPYRLCLNDRDFIGGEYINDCIMEAVAQSSRTIVLLSENFVRSGWCCFGFRTAHVQMFRDRCPRVIVVVVGKIPRNVEPEMALYLKTNTYLHWGEQLFWKKLYFAMPEHRVSTTAPELLPMVQLSRQQLAIEEEDVRR